MKMKEFGPLGARPWRPLRSANGSGPAFGREDKTLGHISSQDAKEQWHIQERCSRGSNPIFAKVSEKIL